jgi:NIMA (never in mitosis gene a)-related kinase
MIGLHTLHTKKILHRDIKTLNIFLDENLNVRIGDLGTAKTLSTEFTNTIVGTPYYLSPEIC